jgi:hypothetical protein
MRPWWLLCAAPLPALFACESSSPVVFQPTRDGGVDAFASADGAVGDAAACASGPFVLGACSASQADYTPRDRASAGTRLPACISDDNVYHPINPDVASNSRIAAFEQVLSMLKVGTPQVPTAADFDAVRVLYTQPEGLDSRVQRREDIHYPPVVIDGVAKECRDLTPAQQAMFADRCAGPAKVVPILNDAFRRGGAGESPKLQATRIEAALLWFMWLSFYKESQGCYADPKQCDSTSSYWGGNQDRGAAPTGYGRYVRALSEESYQRGWDAVLAIRCAFEHSQKSPVPGDLPEVIEKARVQADRINNHALALILRDRIRQLDCDPTAFTFVQILGPVLDVVARAQDPARADALRAEFAKPDAQSLNRALLERELGALFGCP